MFVLCVDENLCKRVPGSVEVEKTQTASNDDVLRLSGALSTLMLDSNCADDSRQSEGAHHIAQHATCEAGVAFLDGLEAVAKDDVRL